jgi:hypothetical protein
MLRTLKLKAAEHGNRNFFTANSTAMVCREWVEKLFGVEEEDEYITVTVSTERVDISSLRATLAGCHIEVERQGEEIEIDLDMVRELDVYENEEYFITVAGSKEDNDD